MIKQSILVSWLVNSTMSVAFAASCPEKTFAEIKSTHNGQGSTNIVFFASWCSSCKPHLQQKHEGKTIFIAVFDERERSEAVIDAFDIIGSCYTSEETATNLGVKALPAVKSFHF